MSNAPVRTRAEDIIAATPIPKQELVKMGRGVSERVQAAGQPIDYDTTTSEAIFQALEDWWGPHYPEISLLIDGITPIRLSVAQKYVFIAEWMRGKADEYEGSV